MADFEGEKVSGHHHEQHSKAAHQSQGQPAYWLQLKSHSTGGLMRCYCTRDVDVEVA